MDWERKVKFNKIYLETREKIYRIALSFMKSKGLAEEIYQEAYLELYEHIHEVEANRAEYWLESVVKNKALNVLKRSTCEGDKYRQLYLRKNDTKDNSAESNLLKKERDDAIVVLCSEVLASLRKENIRWYEAIVKVYGLERPQREVAKEMDVSFAVMRSILFRAKKWVRQQYEEKYIELLGETKK